MTKHVEEKEPETSKEELRARVENGKTWKWIATTLAGMMIASGGFMGSQLWTLSENVASMRATINSEFKADRERDAMAMSRIESEETKITKLQHNQTRVMQAMGMSE